MKSTEKDTQRAIMDWLALKRIFFYRQNTGAFKTEAGGYVQFGSKGSPDLVAVKDGRYIGIEVKDALRGKLSPNQVAFKDNLERAGGIYLVARTLDDVMAYFGV